MGVLKRLLLVLTLATTLLAAATAVAAAQPRPDVTPPNPGASLNLPAPSTDGNNGFQTDRNQCQDTIKTGNDIVDGIIDVVTGGAGIAICTGAAAVLNPGDAVTTGASAVGSLFWGDPVGKFTRAVMEGSTTAFSTLMTFWMRAPIPSLTGTADLSGGQVTSELSASATGMKNITWELQLFALALGVGVGGIRIAVARRHAVADGADETAKMLLRTVFAIWTLPVLVIVLHQVGDSFSMWVIQQSAGEDLNAKINAITWINEQTGMGPVVSLALAGIALIGSLAQLVALLIREAVLALAVGLSPIAAASSVTGTGRQTWSTMISYTVAALLFKPAASLVYAFAFWSATSNTAADAVVGAVLLAVAGLSLPTLLRVIAPTVSTISAGGGQAAAFAAGGGAAAGGAAMVSKAAGGGISSLANKASSGSASPSTPAASGAAPPTSAGRSSGGRSGGGGTAGAATGGGAARTGASSAGASGGRLASAGRATAGSAGAALSGVGVALAGTAAVARAAGRGFSGVSSFAEGAINNGQVPR
ncbi:hypothetical protein [Nocardia sp. XZ_19_369]|uniref:hypothetical protein n=1 Tax=Nocardia sp. XZ_19_369 TaxID=2769487 RepID=UPI0018902E8F|nr:hypothetical protein [Nocardia sp. XZ_19_369]